MGRASSDASALICEFVNCQWRDGNVDIRIKRRIGPTVAL
jgi:hypothetical protein